MGATMDLIVKVYDRTLDLIVHRQIDLLRDPLAIALYPAVDAPEWVDTISDVTPFMAVKPIPLLDVRFGQATLYASPVQFSAFSIGKPHDGWCVYHQTGNPGTSTVLATGGGVDHRPNTGTYLVRFPYGVFRL